MIESDPHSTPASQSQGYEKMWSCGFCMFATSLSQAICGVKIQKNQEHWRGAGMHSPCSQKDVYKRCLILLCSWSQVWTPAGCKMALHDDLSALCSSVILGTHRCTNAENSCFCERGRWVARESLTPSQSGSCPAVTPQRWVSGGAAGVLGSPGWRRLAPAQLTNPNKRHSHIPTNHKAEGTMAGIPKRSPRDAEGSGLVIAGS